MLKMLLSFTLFWLSLPSASAPLEAGKEIVELEGSRIVGVEILVADEGAQVYSSFGHALIRLVDNDGLWANDTVISFAANVQGAINPVTGVVGGYDVSTEVRTLREFWDYYSKNSDRGFKRYPVNMDQNQLDSFLAVLKAYMDDPAPLGDYKFITNNCVSIVTKVFNEAGVGADREDQHNIPRSVNEWIDANLVSAFEPLATSVYKQVKKRLNESPNMDYESLAKSFNDRELAYVFLNHNQLDFETMEALGNYLGENKVDVEDVYGLEPLPEILYSRKYGKEFFAAELEAFGPSAIKNSLRRFIFMHEGRKQNAPLSQENIESTLSKRLLFSAAKDRRDRLVKFSVRSDEERIKARLKFKTTGESANSGLEYTIEGLPGTLTKMDAKTYMVGEGHILRLVETRDSVDFYLLK